MRSFFVAPLTFPLLGGLRALIILVEFVVALDDPPASFLRVGEGWVG